MHRLSISKFLACFLFALHGLALNAAVGQEANVLGLAPIPQPKGGVPPAGAAPKPAAAPAGNNREILAGEMGIQHSALNGIGRIIVTSKAVFATSGLKSTAMDAAKEVQRDLAKACGKQCKAEKMAAPKILPSGQLEFELTFRPLYQHLSQAQFLAAMQSRPLNLTPAQLTPPAPQDAAPPEAAPK